MGNQHCRAKPTASHPSLKIDGGYCCASITPRHGVVQPPELLLFLFTRLYARRVLSVTLFLNDSAQTRRSSIHYFLIMSQKSFLAEGPDEPD